MFGGGASTSGIGIGTPGSGFQSSHQHSITAIGSAMVSPNSSGFGVGHIPSIGGGSPIFQSPAGNKFPASGGPIVFTPHNNPTTPGSLANATPVSPFMYVGGSASSYIQSPPSIVGGVYQSPPPYSSTMISNSTHHQPASSPITHGFTSPAQYSNMQPYGYGSRAMSGGYAYHHSNPYQQQQHNPNLPHYVHGHSPRDEIAEPMHCSPVSQVQPNTIGGPQYQQLQRNPHSPPRPQYMPAFLTGVDAVAAVQPRPRRTFDRSPSTSPPVMGASGSRSPQAKSPGWAQQQEGGQQVMGGYSNPAEGANAIGGGIYTKRAQGQGPSRQLRFNESQSTTTHGQQQNEDNKEKKKVGPPIYGFGSSEDISNFLNSPFLKNNANIVPGAAIAREAIEKESGVIPTADSNWITVFGFPPAAASFIYTHFSQYGSILQSKCNPGGNWLHIQYTSRIDARKALACNGKVLGGTIMVGVISSPIEVIAMYGKPQQEAESIPETSSSTSQQPASAKSPLQERNLDSSLSAVSAKARSIRPLAGASQLASPGLGGNGSFIAPHQNTSALSPSGNENIPLPTASTGLLTKAMEYMFGW